MSLINYGTGYWPKSEAEIPATIFTPQQRTQIVRKDMQIHSEMAKAMAASVAAKKSSECQIKSKYYMPKEAIGVL